jgi:hypothetical protein
LLSKASLSENPNWRGCIGILPTHTPASFDKCEQISGLDNLSGKKAWLSSLRAVSRRTGPSAFAGGDGLPSVFYPMSEGMYVQVFNFLHMFKKGISITETCKFLESEEGQEILKEESIMFRVPKHNLLFVPAGFCVHVLGYNNDSGTKATPPFWQVLFYGIQNKKH